jgi:hypothetical protein
MIFHGKQFDSQQVFPHCLVASGYRRTHVDFRGFWGELIKDHELLGCGVFFKWWVGGTAGITLW